eukprot:CAMPEP_0185182690 /NCGR_PEP_ID=MMETSP1140-20130426/1509_1 /TAXON_ID=298111 /ORGANISM="Pavlova sp., Strain CCMP459" /LENGTH=134 /DNA_ID=CAMNT_0027748653 /DNA_START=437 /DNA_END=841 /DNA_ORIENTATION=-
MSPPCGSVCSLLTLTTPPQIRRCWRNQDRVSLRGNISGKWRALVLLLLLHRTGALGTPPAAALADGCPQSTAPVVCALLGMTSADRGVRVLDLVSCRLWDDATPTYGLAACEWRQRRGLHGCQPPQTERVTVWD